MLRPSGLLASHQADLCLCFRGTERDGQVVRISANKCTIGSSADCTLRIVCPGVRPIHCIILRGEGGMAIRRLSLDTFLNGESFGDATLVPGDHITIGPIEFDVLPEIPRALDGTRAQAPSARPDHGGLSVDLPADRHLREAANRITRLERTIAQRQSETHLLFQEMQRLTGQIDDVRQQWHTSPHQLGEYFDAWRGKVQELEDQFGEQRRAYDEDRSSWLKQCQKIATSLQEVSRTHQDTIEHNLKAFHQRIVEVDQRFGELLEREQEVSRKQADLEQARVDFDQRVPEWEADCKQKRRDLAKDRAAFDSQRKDWDTQGAEEQDRLEQWAQKLEQEEKDQEIAQQRLQDLERRDADQTSLRSEIEELQSRCAELTQELEQTRQQKQQQEQAKQKLSHELQEARDQLEKIANSPPHEASMQGEQELLQARCDELTRELEFAQQEKDHQQAEYEALQQQLDSLREEEAGDPAREDDAELGQLRQQLEARESELQQLQSRQQREQKEATDQLKARQKQLDEQWEQLRQEQARLEQAREEWQIQCELDVSQKPPVEDEAAGALADQSHAWQQEREQWLAEYEQKCVAFVEERATWEARRDQQDHEFNDRRARLDREFDELQQLRESLREQEASAGAAGELQRQELDARLKEIERERQQGLAEIEAIRQQLDEERAALRPSPQQEPSERPLGTQTVPVEGPADLRQGPFPPEHDLTGLDAVDDRLTAEQHPAVENTDPIISEVAGNETATADDLHASSFDTPDGRSESEEGEGADQELEPVAPRNDENATLVSTGPRNEQEVVFSEPTETAPVDTAEVLARFGHTTQPVEDQELPLNASEEDDEALRVYGESDSVHNYMAELMERVEGGISPTISRVDASPVGRPQGQVAGDGVADGVAPEIDCVETLPLDPSDFIPRAVAPEAASNLQALRAVANTSARSAIDKHQRQRFENLARISWGVAFVSMMVCGAWVVWVDDLFSFPTYASIASFLVSVYAVSRALMYTAKAKFGSHATRKTLAENGFDISLDDNADQEQPAGVLDPSLGAFPSTSTLPLATDLPPGATEMDPSMPPDVPPVGIETPPAGALPEQPTLHVETARPETQTLNVENSVPGQATNSSAPAVETATTVQPSEVIKPTLETPPTVPPDTPTLIVDHEKNP